MKLLLDTHIWIWSKTAATKLPAKFRKVLSDPDNEFCLSPVSVWEFYTLLRKGRIDSPSIPAPIWVEMATANMTEAYLTHAIAQTSCQLKLPQSDPADRFIAATAAEHDLTLLTVDKELLAGAALNHQYKVMKPR